MELTLMSKVSSLASISVRLDVSSAAPGSRPYSMSPKVPAAQSDAAAPQLPSKACTAPLVTSSRNPAMAESQPITVEDVDCTFGDEDCTFGDEESALTGCDKPGDGADTVAGGTPAWRSARNSSGTKVCTQYSTPGSNAWPDAWTCTAEPCVVVTRESIQPSVTAVSSPMGLPEAKRWKSCQPTPSSNGTPKRCHPGSMCLVTDVK